MLTKSSPGLHIAFRRIIPLLIFSACGMPWSPTGYCADAALEAQYRALDEHVKTPAVRAELDALVAVPAEEIPARFLTFKPHAYNKSRLDVHQDSSRRPAGIVKLSKDTKSAFVRALQTRADLVPGVNPKSAATGNLSQGQLWRALEALENDIGYDGAARLAEEMATRESAGEAKELLTLIAARNTYLAYAGKGPRYEQLLSQASQAASPNVAHQAQLWTEALSGPKSLESLSLAFQAWETVYHELRFREKSGLLCLMICQAAPGVVEQILTSQQSEDEKQRQVGRVVSIVSEAAYQLANEKVLKWAVDTATPLTLVDLEDKLTPQYFTAYYLFSQNKYEASRDAFGELFLSGQSCDVAADAGIRMAVCHVKLRNDVGALACLDVVDQLYSRQAYAVNNAQTVREYLLQRNLDLDKQLVCQLLQFAVSPGSPDSPSQYPRATLPSQLSA